MGVLERFSLKGKVSIVTGGAGLYGKSIVEGLAEAGSFVYIASRNLENCKKLAEELKNKGYYAEGVELDLAKTESIVKLKEKVISERGKIDILVNNALLRTTTSPDISTEELELSMKVNAVGVINIIRIISDEMKKRKSGVIINISSIYGVLGCDPCLYKKTEVKMAGPDYYFNKAGIINITRYYASLLGAYNIRVNCISPGGLFSNQDPKFVEKYNKKTCLGRMANSENIKGVVVFLASDASSYITGENIMMDGGLSIK